MSIRLGIVVFLFFSFAFNMIGQNTEYRSKIVYEFLSDSLLSKIDSLDKSDFKLREDTFDERMRLISSIDYYEGAISKRRVFEYGPDFKSIEFYNKEGELISTNTKEFYALGEKSTHERLRENFTLISTTDTVLLTDTLIRVNVIQIKNGDTTYSRVRRKYLDPVEKKYIEIIEGNDDRSGLEHSYYEKELTLNSSDFQVVNSMLIENGDTLSFENTTTIHDRFGNTTRTTIESSRNNIGYRSKRLRKYVAQYTHGKIQRTQSYVYSKGEWSLLEEKTYYYDQVTMLLQWKRSERRGKQPVIHIFEYK